MGRSAIVILIALTAAVAASWAGAEPEPRNNAPKRPAPPGALDEPLHWSAPPRKLAGDLVVTKSWFIQFELPDGSREIPARVFLIESRNSNGRISCNGHEIDAPGVYEPDYYVPKRYVQPMLPGIYRVSLGNIDAFVHTVQ